MAHSIAPTLSIIHEASERSESAHSSYEPVVIPETSRYSDNYYGAATTTIPRASIFSSETSYGEILPPGQSAFRNLGLGVLLPEYDKSLPSLPRDSVAAMSASARSGRKTESDAGSVARSDASKSSVARSEALRHSPSKSQSPRQSTIRTIESPRGSIDKHKSSVGKAKSDSLHKLEKSERAAVIAESRSSRGSELTLTSAPVVPVSSSPLPPPLPSKESSVSSISTVSTHSNSHSRLESGSHTGSTSSSTSSSQPTSVSLVSIQSTLRTFDDVVDEAATSLAVRAIMGAETMQTSDRTKIGVCTTIVRGDDQRFMRILAEKLHHSMLLHSSYLFALMPSSPSPGPGHTTLVFCGAPQQLVTRASILAGLRFKTRLAELQDAVGTWIGQLEPAELDAWGAHARNEDVLWDIVRKAVNSANPTEPPPGSRSVESILFDARSRLDRLNPAEAFTEAMGDGILVDIRPARERAEHGTIPGALIIERNILEWRFDPRCVERRLPIADRYDLRIIVYCQDGHASSLAAAALQGLGLCQATDIDGGFSRWKHEGFPVNGAPTDAPMSDYRSLTPATPRLA